MVRKLSVREFRANLSDTLGAVYYTNEPVIVEKNGKPVAAVISPKQWERLRQAVSDDAWEAIQHIRELNADKDPDEVYADVTGEVEAVRQEMYEERESERRYG